MVVHIHRPQMAAPLLPVGQAVTRYASARMSRKDTQDTVSAAHPAHLGQQNRYRGAGLKCPWTYNVLWHPPAPRLPLWHRKNSLATPSCAPAALHPPIRALGMALSVPASGHASPCQTILSRPQRLGLRGPVVTQYAQARHAQGTPTTKSFR